MDIGSFAEVGPGGGAQADVDPISDAAACCELLLA